jgi:hypothetical protein
MFKPEVPLVELHGAIEVGDVDRNVIDTFEHIFTPA